MAGVLDGVDQRTQLVGANRLELLIFKLGAKQKYGINVFKVQEVIHCPTLTAIPNSNPIVCGIANMRGRTIMVLDLAHAIGLKPLENRSDCFVIIAEYNRVIQGFLVKSVDRIVNMNWKEILPPPKGLGKENYMTAVTRVDEEMVEIIDVEKIFAELAGVTIEISDESKIEVDRVLTIMVIDDSSVARNQIKRTLEKMGMAVLLGKDGSDGLSQLKALADKGDIFDSIDMVISDVEMPVMDGYTLTTEIKADERMKKLPVLLHTSLSGVFNSTMVEKVGADKFVPKFNAEELSNEVKKLLVSFNRI
ncbi:Chemotaxis protein CheV [hydrothermal vent metagenome]|uniref:Chemotaxis protein CheV n=1 Tax=hydrothermal vent metagenome TaxID=652676 RepID=A0A3B1A335_9ZZZZ